MNNTQKSIKNSKNSLLKTGRPILDNNKKRKTKISFYINKEEYEKYINLKDILPIDMAISDFFRYIINISNIELFKQIGIKYYEKENIKKISISHILKYISMNDSSFKKLLYRLNIKPKTFFSVSDLKHIRSSISDKHYKSRLLILRLDKFIENMS